MSEKTITMIRRLIETAQEKPAARLAMCCASHQRLEWIQVLFDSQLTLMGLRARWQGRELLFENGSKLTLLRYEPADRPGTEPCTVSLPAIQKSRWLRGMEAMDKLWKRWEEYWGNPHA